METRNHQNDRGQDATLVSILENTRVPEPSKQFVTRIIDLPRTLPREKQAWAFVGFWRPFSLGLGTLVVGLFLGHVTAPRQQVSEVREAEFEQVFSNLVLASTSIPTVSESE